LDVGVGVAVLGRRVDSGGFPDVEHVGEFGDEAGVDEGAFAGAGGGVERTIRSAMRRWRSSVISRLRPKMGAFLGIGWGPMKGFFMGYGVQ
jgi:hypothetical protein